MQTKRILKWALIAAIVIVLNLFFNYTVSLIYKAPSYELFCPVELTNTAYTDKNQCVNAGGQWTESIAPGIADANGKTKPTMVQPQVTGYCNPTYTCQKQFEGAQKIYNRNVFMVLVGAGVLSIAVGVWLQAIAIVSIGFSFGGVLSLIIGSMRYWSDMQDWLRVAVLALALAVLVWIGVKKMKE